MSDFDTLFAGAAMPGMFALHGETVEYAANGSSYTTYTGIVERGPAADTGGNVDYALRVILPNSVTIPVPKVSKVKIAPKVGATRVAYSVADLVSSSGAWVVVVK